MNRRKIILVLALLVTLTFIFTGCRTESTKKENEDMNSANMLVIPESKETDLMPGTPDYALAVEKGIMKNEEDTDSYLRAELAYLALFNEYLNKNGSVDSYQTMLDDSEYNYIVTKSDVYLERGAFGRANIAIRNRAFIERLEKEDLELLTASIKDGKVSETDVLDEMIDRTWEDLIRVELEEGDTSIHEIVYDEKGSNKMMAMNNAIVFELYYSPEFVNGKISGDAADKYKEAVRIAELMEKEIGNSIGHEVAVIIKEG